MRHPSRVRALGIIGLLVGSIALFGCPKRPEVIQATPSAPGPVAAPTPAPPPPPAPPSSRVAETPVVPPAPAVPPPVAASAPPPLKDVFFSFDRNAIREDQKAGLNENIGWLKANTGAKITIEGHCDERGTAEYNLALAERRAKAAKEYLVKAGIAADRISVISYGKERPFVLGHDECPWTRNRRAHFVVQKK